MIEELDETLRKLLEYELHKPGLGKIEIAFNQPTREWSSRLNNPTLNLFLYNVFENAQMRQMAQSMFERSRTEVNRYNSNGKKNGSTTVDTVNRSQAPLRVDLHYMITAWANEPDDEHRILGRTLIALSKYLTIPTDLRVSRDDALVPAKDRLEPLSDDSPDHVLPRYVRELNLPVHLQIAREDVCSRMVEVWGVLDNEMRPSIYCVMTAPINPYQPFDTPIVKRAEFYISPSRQPVPRDQRIHRDATPNEESYSRNRDDVERNSKPKQNVDSVVLSQTPTPISAAVYARGFVRRRDSSAALQNLEVRLYTERNGKRDIEAGRVVVQPDGTFTLFNLMPQSYRIVVSADDIAEFETKFSVPQADPTAEIKIEV